MTTWSTQSKQTTTWTVAVTGGTFASLPFGYGPFGGIGSASWSAVSQASSSWSAVNQQTSTWVQVAQSGKPEAMFEYNEPLGGPVWEDVDKDA